MAELLGPVALSEIAIMLSSGEFDYGDDGSGNDSTPASFEYHTGDEIPISSSVDIDLFNLATVGTQSFELVPNYPNGNLSLYLFDEDFSGEDRSDDDEIEIDIESVDYVSAPQSRTWMVHLHDGALMPIVTLDSINFARGVLRTYTLEFRVASRRTVQVHLTGVIVNAVETDRVLAAIIARAEKRSVDALRGVAFRGDVLFSGASDDESLLVLNEIHTAASAAASRIQNLRPKRGAKAL